MVKRPGTPWLTQPSAPATSPFGSALGEFESSRLTREYGSARRAVAAAGPPLSNDAAKAYPKAMRQSDAVLKIGRERSTP